MFTILSFIAAVLISSLLGAICFGVLSGSYSCFAGMLMILGVYNACISALVGVPVHLLLHRLKQGVIVYGVAGFAVGGLILYFIPHQRDPSLLWVGGSIGLANAVVFRLVHQVLERGHRVKRK